MGDDEIVDEIPKERNKVVIGSADKARTVEYQLTHMAKSLDFEICASPNRKKRLV